MAETILVVDDEAGNRELLEAILEDAGYQVQQADGGMAALAVHRAIRHRQDTLAKAHEIARLRAHIAELEHGRTTQ